MIPQRIKDEVDAEMREMLQIPQEDKIMSRENASEDRSLKAWALAVLEVLFKNTGPDLGTQIGFTLTRTRLTHSPLATSIICYLTAGSVLVLMVVCYVAAMIVMVTVLAHVSRDVVQFLVPAVEDDVVYGLAVLWGVWVIQDTWRLYFAQSKPKREAF